MQIAILAGGLATRLRPVTTKIPKALLPVHGKPFLQYQLELLKKNGVRDVVLCTGYLHRQISDFFGNGRKFGVNIRYSTEQGKLLGTGGALKKAGRYLGRNFFVMYGDSYLPIDFRKVWACHEKYTEPVVMTVFRNGNSLDKSNVKTAKGLVSVYDKDSREKLDYIDYGLLVFRKEVLDDLPAGRKCGLEALLGRYAGENRIRACEVRKRFYEIGSPKGLEEFRRYIKAK